MCWDERRKRKAAVKRVKPMAEHIEDAKHTLREIRLMQMLGDHPNVAGLHDMWMPLEPGQPPTDELYLTLDLFDTDLSQIIKSSHAISRDHIRVVVYQTCLLYTSPSPRDATLSRMPSSA